MRVILESIPGKLVENTQRNPLRWMCVKEKEPGVFVNTTNQFKCKDYLNDFCVFKHTGTVFYQYGMCSNQCTFDEKGGAWLLLLNVTKELQNNLKNCVAEVFKDQWGVQLEYYPLEEGVEGATAGLLYVPTLGWHSTWRISLISLCVRSLNIPKEIKDWDQMLDYSFFYEGHLFPVLLSLLQQKILTFPNEQEYVYYAGVDGNSKNLKYPTMIGEYVHNNGISGRFQNINYTTEIPGFTYKSFDPYKLHNNLKDIVEIEEEEEMEWEDDEELTEEN